MKICPKCNKEHNKPGVYCCRSHANGRKHSDDTKNNISTGVRKYLEELTEDEKIESSNRSRRTVKIAAEVAHFNAKKRLEETPFDDLNGNLKRGRILAEQDSKCHRCGIDRWMGQAIVLDIDHIDGNRKNNARENLVGLCPNCHSQTPTFRGRNQKAPKKVEDAVLIQAIKDNPKSISKALESLGMAPKGGNFKRAKNLISSNVELIGLYMGNANLDTLFPLIQ